MLQKKRLILFMLLSCYQCTKTMEQHTITNIKNSKKRTQEQISSTTRQNPKQESSSRYQDLLEMATALVKTTQSATEEVDRTTSLQDRVVVMKQLSSIRDALTPLLNQDLYSLERQIAAEHASLNLKNPLIDRFLELPIQILRYLAPQDIIKLQRVCKSWSHIWDNEHLLSFDSKKITKLDECKSLHNGVRALAEKLNRYPNPVEIVFKAEDLTENLNIPHAELEEIKRLKRIVILGDNSARIRFNSKGSLHSVCQIKGLEELIIRNCKLSFFSKPRCGNPQPTSLKKLDLTGNNLKIISLDPSYVPQLKELLLTIENFADISNVMLSELKSLEKLTIVTIDPKQIDLIIFCSNNPKFKFIHTSFDKEKLYTTLIFLTEEASQQVAEDLLIAPIHTTLIPMATPQPVITAPAQQLLPPPPPPFPFNPFNDTDFFRMTSDEDFPIILPPYNYFLQPNEPDILFSSQQVQQDKQ